MFPRLSVLLVALLISACGDSAGSGPSGTGDVAQDDSRPGRDAVSDADNEDDQDASEDAAQDRESGEDTVEDSDSDEPREPVAVVPGDITGRAGVPIEFDGSGSYDPDGEVVDWEWRFGDGSESSGESAFYTYSNAGVFIVTLTVTDDDDLTGSVTFEADIGETSEGPTATIVGPDFVVTGERASFDGGDSSGDGISFLWDVGVAEVDPIDGETLDYTWTELGEVELSLTVEDELGDTDTASRDLPVLARPVARIVAPDSITVGEAVTFDGSTSSDEDGTIAGYEWTFPDDPTSSTAPFPEHTFIAPGEPIIWLTVTDDDGLTHTTSTKVNVAAAPNVCPSVLIVQVLPLPPISTGATVTVTASAGDDDGIIEQYEWDWGDGTVEVGAAVHAHTYSTAGSYVIKVTVTDDAGCTYVAEDSSTHRARAQTPVTILNRCPTVTISERDPAGAIDSGTNLSVTVTANDPDGTVDQLWWDWGDDSTGSGGATNSHTYASSGNYTLTVTATDDLGCTYNVDSASTYGARATASIPVNNVCPTVTIDSRTPSGQVDTGAEITMSVTASDPDGSVAEIEWDWDDGTVETGQTERTHTFSDDGDYSVAVTVTDDEGCTLVEGDVTTLSAQDVHTVEVGNRCPQAEISSVLPGTDVEAGTTVAFTGNSNDPDGTIATRNWDWGDTTATLDGTPEESHLYSEEGVFKVTLEVIDDDGCSDSVQVTVTVTGVKPVATLTVNGGASVEANVDEDLSFDASGSYHPDSPDTEIASMEINFGNGSTWTLPESGLFTFSYGADGEYTAVLTVTDDDGLTATAEVTVTVGDPVEPGRTGNYDLNTTPQFLCGYDVFVGSHLVDYSFERIQVVDDEGEASAVPWPSTLPPGTLVGTFDGDHLIATKVFYEDPDVGGCRETYTLDITFAEDGTTFSGVWRANYEDKGDFCGFVTCCPDDCDLDSIPPGDDYAVSISGTKVD